MVEIRRDDPLSAHAAALLAEHVADVTQHAPPESCHSMPAEALRSSGAAFWTVWIRGELVGCGALKPIDETHGEIKSMRTRAGYRRRGVGSALLEHILGFARDEGLSRVSLETGAQDAFEPARAMYARFGFVECGPFGEYREDPHSVFMTLELTGR